MKRGLPPWPPFSAGSLERKHVSLDSASAAPSRVVEVAASCTVGDARALTRQGLTAPPYGVDEAASPISPAIRRKTASMASLTGG